MIVCLGQFKKKGSILCNGVLVYLETSGNDENDIPEEVDVMFLRDGYVRHKSESEDDEDVTALWRFPAREDDGHRAVVRERDVQDEDLSGNVSKKARRSRFSEARKTGGKKRAQRTPKKSVDVREHGGAAVPEQEVKRTIQPLSKSSETVVEPVSGSVANGSSVSPANTSMLDVVAPVDEGRLYRKNGYDRNKRECEMESMLGKEIRVTAKRAVCMAVMRPPGRVVSTGDGPDFDGVLNTGVILWSTKMIMERFQLFAAMMLRFSRDVFQK